LKKVAESGKRHLRDKRREEGKLMGNERKYHCPRQTSILSNAEPEAKPVVVVAPRSGEARRQKGQLGEKQLVEIYWEYFRKTRMKKRC
jgi:hypothetical protein